MAFAQRLQPDRPRTAQHPRLRAGDGARSLQFSRDDAKGITAVTAIYGHDTGGVAVGGFANPPYGIASRESGIYWLRPEIA